MKTKLCSKCKTAKDFTNFGIHRKTKDGKDSWCKDCKREDHRLRNRTPERKAYNKRYNQSAKAKKHRKEYCQRPEVKARQAEKMRQYRENPELKLRFDARRIARNAYRKGLLKEQPCALCNCPDVQKHHPDYSKPLLIVWVCFKCHQKLHAKAEREG